MKSSIALADLPECLTVADIAGYLGIAKAKTYELVRIDGFPKLLLGGKRIIIPKQAFEVWLRENTVTSREA